MRITLSPRLMPRGGGRGSVGDDPLLVSLGSGEETNRAVLAGLIVAEPLRDKSRDGRPITVFLISFSDPDEQAGEASACCEVEVMDSIADPHRWRLGVGRRIWVAGQLTGSGLWATTLGTA
jgi:primosomal replication protein N